MDTETQKPMETGRNGGRGLRGAALLLLLCATGFLVWRIQRVSSLRQQAKRLYGAIPEVVSSGRLPDGQRWLAFREDYAGNLTLHMFSKDAPEEAPKSIPVPKEVHTLLGVSPDYRLFAADFPQNPDPQKVTLFEIGLYPNPATLKRYTVTLPPDSRAEEMALAPQGDRLLWKLHIRFVPSIRKLLARFLASQRNAPPVEGAALWLTRPDGQGWRQVGFQEILPGASPKANISGIGWLPDSQTVLFHSEGAAYLLPVLAGR